MDLGPGDPGPGGSLKKGVGVKGDRASWVPLPMAVDTGQALTVWLQ